jgi:hypothetical protein
LYLGQCVGPCAQDKITEARVEAERALANAFQKHALAAGLSEWAGQVIGTSGATWFGGVELSPAINTSALVSMDLKQIRPGLERVVVWCIAIWSCCTLPEIPSRNWLT